MSPNTRQQNSTGVKRKRATIRIWTEEEERQIAHYLAEKPYLGKDQAKETLAQYERRMLSELMFNDCDATRLKNKISSMKKKFDEVTKWINETGQGVQDGDPAAFPDVVIQMCHYYYILQNIYLCSQSVNTSYQRNDGQIQENEFTPITEPQAAITTVPIIIDEAGNELAAFSTPEIENASADDNTPTTKFAKFNNFIEGKDRSKCRPRAAPNKMLEDLYANKQQLKLELETMKLDFEKMKWTESRDLELKKLEAQKELALINSNKELELKKLSLEEKKLELEILRERNK